MTNRLKLAIQITIFAAAVLLIGWGVWVVFFSSDGPGIGLAPISEPTGAPGQLPPIGAGTGGNVLETGPGVLTPEGSPEATGPSLVATGGRTQAQTLTQGRADFAVNSGSSFNYYDPASERFYKISENGGEPVLLSTERFPAVETVTWSKTGGKAVLEFPDGSNIVYDFNTGQQATLPLAAREFSFSPDEQALAYEYIGNSRDDRWIVASNANGEGQTLIQALGDKAHNVQINWSPTNEVVATYRAVTSGAGEEVFFIGLNGENYLSLQTNGLGFTGAWSPAGEQMLYSVYSPATNYNPVLHIAGARGDNIGANNRSLRLATWPDKCTFADETLVYCAVPQSLEAGSGMFPEIAANVPDTIYRVDLINNSVTPLATPEAADQNLFTIENLTLASNGQELYFTDRVTGRIHRLRLR